MFLNKFKSSLVGLSMAAAAAFAPSAHASLIGDTITASGNSLNPSVATIGSGIEFHGIASYINFDFGADTLTLTPNAWISWSGFGTYTFTGFSHQITGLSIASNSGFTGNEIANYSFTSNSISIDMNSGRTTSAAVELVYNIETAAVPEPGILALFGIALLGIATARRNKRG